MWMPKAWCGPPPMAPRAPGGYLVVAGTPPAATAPRPLRNADTEGTTRLAAADDPLLLRPPPPRPGDLGERWERARNGGRTADELRQMRPSPRPAEAAAIAAALFAAAKPHVHVEPVTGTTPRPAARPDSVARAARAHRAERSQAALASAASTAAVLRQSAATAPATPKPAPAPVAPQTQSETPNFSKNAPSTTPSKAPTNVAKRATDPNELNLSKVNLLGTFGKSGAMRALVRLPSGRVINVAVGDRMDRGRVVAIGQGELRYVKGNRNITLNMPRG